MAMRNDDTALNCYTSFSDERDFIAFYLSDNPTAIAAEVRAALIRRGFEMRKSAFKAAVIAFSIPTRPVNERDTETRCEQVEARVNEYFDAAEAYSTAGTLLEIAGSAARARRVLEVMISQS